MNSSRLEAFSDGVIAIIITIMVLEMGAPEDTSWNGLLAIIPTFLSYILSFIYVGIYWNNHHHLFQVTGKVNGGVLWANLHLLFWLSLIPFTTAWVGEHHLTALPVAAYGFVLLMAAVAWLFLQKALIRIDPDNQRLQKVTRSGPKEIASAVCYAIAIGGAFINVWISIILIAGVALLWIIPERTIE